MSGNGDIYSGPEIEGRFHHSSFLAGQPTAAAGELVAKDGRITNISKRSGHYLHEPEYIRQFVSELESRGVTGLRQIKIQNSLH